ncbi:orexin receptor type 2-like [Littorina saxatilis]|uniref:orexin receptor type 2-like n=1 Tax=Littorina saxatilis TaxID=31220 RepID=UPI0038B6112E
MALDENGYTDSEVEEYLRAKNTAFTFALIPTIVYIVVLMVVGLVGNTIVFIVYYKRFKPSVVRTYILAISVCDLLTNILVLPADAFEIRFHYTYHSDFACKMTRTVRVYLVLLSGLILVAVAYVRQKTICQLHESSPIRFNKVYLSLVLCCFVAFVLSVPYFILTGSSMRALKGTNITGVACGIANEHYHSTFHSVFQAILNTVYVIGVLIMGIAYARIARFLWLYKREANTVRITKVGKTSYENGREPSATVNEDAGRGHTVDTHVVPEDYTNSSVVSELAETELHAEKDTDRNPSAPNMPSSLPRGTFATNSTLPRSQTRHTQASKTLATRAGFQIKRVPARTTYMLFILTVVFTLNFLPYLVFITIDLVNPGIMTGLNVNLTGIFTRSFLLNSAINPIVYCFCSAKVRQECLLLLRSCRRASISRRL